MKNYVTWADLLIIIVSIYVLILAIRFHYTGAFFGG